MSATPGPTPPRPDDTPLRAGVEITLLLWVRTGVALMAFGFFLTRITLLFQEVEDVAPTPPGRAAHPSLWGGIGFLLAGSVLCLAAAWFHHRFLRRLPPPARELPATFSLGLALAGAVALAGLALATYLGLTV
jgi:putative membrane protein